MMQKQAQPRRILHSLIAAVIAVPLIASGLLLATSSTASAIDADWSQPSVPSTAFADNYAAHVSCVANTTFCVVLEPDSSTVTATSDYIGDASLVTTDGSDWTDYATLPFATDEGGNSVPVQWNAVSCYSQSDCWVAGSGPEEQPEVAQSTDGGETWALMTPDAWATGSYTWWPNSIDCVTAATCWLAGVVSDDGGAVAAVTTDSGQTWTTFATSADASEDWVDDATLPFTGQIDPTDPTEWTGMYALEGISCVSALSCVAVGGLNDSEGTAQAISTTDGGASWTLSPDPTLSGIQSFWGLSCVAQASGVPWCEGVGSALSASGPVTLTSADGGVTWSGEEFLEGGGWLSSDSCADVSDCWAGGAGTALSLAGTNDGGQTWQTTDDDTTDEEVAVSCASVDFCVATTGDGLFVTTDDGGLVQSSALDRPLARSTRSKAADSTTEKLPEVTPQSASTQAGKPFTFVDQDRSARSGAPVTLHIKSPMGTTTASTTVQLNDFFSYRFTSLMTGATTITPYVGASKRPSVVVNAYPAAAPVVSSVTPAAGPTAGGNSVTISGRNFTGATKVLFGSSAGTLVRVAADSLTVTAPKGAGVVPITVVTAKGGPSSISSKARYTYAPAPSVSHVSPGSGVTAGGNLVELRGTGLVWARQVRFGTHAASDIRVLNAGTISVRAPAGTGKVNVVVIAAGGTSAVAKGTTYSY